MNRKCSSCRLVNYTEAAKCARCDADLLTVANIETKQKITAAGIVVRAVVCLCVCLAVLFGFYLSLIASAKRLTLDEKEAVCRATAIVREKGFSTEAMLLDNFTAYRSNDNWLNASVAKESAYAATNFPFEIMTVYSDFFTYPTDDVERAAILLHEARHLRGQNEHDAYAFVWKNRQKLGWTRDKYLYSPVWSNIRRQTKDNVPELFTCVDNELGDCTE